MATCYTHPPLPAARCRAQEVVHETGGGAVGDGAGLILVAETDTGCLLSGSPGPPEWATSAVDQMVLQGGGGREGQRGGLHSGAAGRGAEKATGCQRAIDRHGLPAE